MASIPSPIRKWIRRYITGEGSNEIANQSPVQSVNSQTGDVTISTGGGSIPPSQTVTSYSDLPTTDLSEAEIWLVAGEEDVVVSTQLSPVVWRSVSDFTKVASQIPDSEADQKLSHRWYLSEDSGPFADEIGSNDGTDNGTTQVTGDYVDGAARSADGTANISTGSFGDWPVGTSSDSFALAFTVKFSDTASEGRLMGDFGNIDLRVEFNRNGNGSSDGGNLGLIMFDGSNTGFDLNQNIGDGQPHRVVFNVESISNDNYSAFVDQGSDTSSVRQTGFSSLQNVSNDWQLFDAGGKDNKVDTVLDDVCLYDEGLTTIEAQSYSNPF